MVSDAFIEFILGAGWPQEFKEKLHIGNVKSPVGIATLWTHTETVYRDLDPESYAIVGNYYDRRNAFEPFVRNCLANPNIRYVILVGNDKAQSREVLVNFFKDGIEGSVVAGTDCKVPLGIPVEDLELLRENVTLIDIVDEITDLGDSAGYAAAIQKVIASLDLDLEPYGEPKLYEKQAIEVDQYPSEGVGFVLRGQTVGDVWLKVLRTVYDYGRMVKMKKTDSNEVRLCQNIMTIVSEEDPDNPQMQEFFRFDEPYLKSYYDEICTDKIPEGTLYTYGSRLRSWELGDEIVDQVADIISYLKEDPYRASAVAHTWRVEHELTRRIKNKDLNSPCIVLVHPYAPDEKLSLTVYIRSNDMFRAWPLNAFGLRKLQKIIAEGLGLPMGDLVIISSSAHIYQDNWEDTKEILEKHYTSTNCFWDPRGYYAIVLNGGKIKVTHYSPQSEALKEYEGTLAREINDAINSSQHPIDGYHSSYLGEELMKAEIALKLGIEYTQDEPLDFAELSGGVATGGVCGPNTCS